MLSVGGTVSSPSDELALYYVAAYTIEKKNPPITRNYISPI
jgi:hypothetical protein